MLPRAGSAFYSPGQWRQQRDNDRPLPINTTFLRLRRPGREQPFPIRFECRFRSLEIIGNTLERYAWRERTPQVDPVN
jgi:hypothetical protein